VRAIAVGYARPKIARLGADCLSNASAAHHQVAER
jgi:hypothetical protein